MPHARHIYGLYAITTPEESASVVESARAMAPAIEPLDGAAADFARELGSLATIVDEANRYYDRATYEDDEMTHGAEMHRPLLDAFDRFVAATVALEAAIDPLFDEMLTTRVAGLEDNDAFASRPLRLDAHGVRDRRGGQRPLA